MNVQSLRLITPRYPSLDKENSGAVMHGSPVVRLVSAMAQGVYFLRDDFKELNRNLASPAVSCIQKESHRNDEQTFS